MLKYYSCDQKFACWTSSPGSPGFIRIPVDLPNCVLQPLVGTSLLRTPGVHDVSSKQTTSNDVYLAPMSGRRRKLLRDEEKDKSNADRFCELPEHYIEIAFAFLTELLHQLTQRLLSI